MTEKIGEFEIIKPLPRYLNRGPDDVEAFIINYKLNELDLRGWLYKPADNPVENPANPIDSKSPDNGVLVVGHGGVEGIRVHYDVALRRLAKAGWTIIVPSYRGEDGSGGEIEFAKGEVDDTRVCLELVETIPWIDNPTVWLLGSSHGAIVNAILAGSNVLPLVKGLVLSTGVFDLEPWLEWLVENDHDLLKITQISDLITGEREEIAVRSPVSYAEKIKLPVLVIYAGEDKMVPVEQSKSMIAALREGGNDNVTVHEAVGAEHDFIWGPDRHAAVEAWSVIIDFMNS